MSPLLAAPIGLALLFVPGAFPLVCLGALAVVAVSFLGGLRDMLR